MVVLKILFPWLIQLKLLKSDVPSKITNLLPGAGPRIVIFSFPSMTTSSLKVSIFSVILKYIVPESRSDNAFFIVL